MGFYRIPSTLESVISVGAVSKFNFRLRWSNYGSCVGVYAKGENVRGPVSKSVKARAKRSGTSVAAAIVIGHIAAYLGENSEATPSEVRDWILSRCVKGKVKNLNKSYREGALLLVEP